MPDNPYASPQASLLSDEVVAALRAARRRWILILLIAAAATALLGLVGGFFAGFSAKRSAIDTMWGYQFRFEFFVVKDNLENRNPSPQLREYLKQRLYYLAAKLPPEDIPSDKQDFDFGPVDKTVLGQAYAHASAELRGREYEIAKKQHNPRASVYLAPR